MITLYIMIGYLGLLIGLGVLSKRMFRGTAGDYFLASHSIGPVVLLMSVFGTTMTAFALVGSSGEAYKGGIGAYGMMASWSGLIHAAVFFIIGIRLWAIGKRYAYQTQIQFFRDRFESPMLGALLFPILVGLVIPYLLVGLLGAGSVVRALTAGTFPDAFPTGVPGTNGGVPPWLTGLVICGVVLSYIFIGGVRAAAWANTFQTIVFMITGVVAFYVISNKLGGLAAASQAVLDHEELALRMRRGGEGQVSQLQFMTYAFIPLSVGMFPHLFQHWLTAKSAKSFRLTVVAHPIFIMLVWVPCVLIGVWATTAKMPDGITNVVPPNFGNPNAVLAMMVKKLTGPVLGGVLGAGILAAIMSSLDSQFFCIGTIFTRELNHYFGDDKFTDKQQVLYARVFIVAIVGVTYAISLVKNLPVFTLGIWCFSGFAALFPLVFAALYWRRTTKAGAIACVLTTAAAWFLLFRAGDYGANREYLFHGVMPVTVMFGASVAALVGVSLVTSPPPPEKVARFFPTAPSG